MDIRALIGAGALFAMLLFSPWHTGAQAAHAERVVILSTEFAMAGKFDMVAEAARQAGVDVEHHYVERLEPAELGDVLSGASLLLLDVPRNPDARRMEEALEPFGKALPSRRLAILAAGPQPTGLSAEQGETLWQYYRNGGSENMRRMFSWIRQQLFGHTGLSMLPPIMFPEIGIYHPRNPGAVFDTVEAYFKWLGADPAAPVVAVLFHQSNLASGLHAHLDDFVARLEHLGAVALPFYAPMHDEGVFRSLLNEADGQPHYQVMVSFQAMYQGRQREQYQAQGVPVLQAITWRGGDRADWLNDPVGLPISGVPFYLAVPEYTGITDPLMVAAIENGSPKAIPEQMESMARKALKLARLQGKANADKQVAILFYNYPPGEKNLSASFLNVPRSLVRVMEGMAGVGYTLTPMDEDSIIEQASALLRPFYREDSLQPLLDAGLAERLPMSTYRAWFDALPASVREEVIVRWGEPEADPMVQREDGRDYFVIPMIRNGHLALLPQPPRGQRGEDAERAIYHDTKVPLNHFYMAAYLHLREGFGADALVHFGTHGTQEWTPGKERGLWVYDYPYLVLGDTPVVYPYIVDNIGEATQAKRRGRATIISHQTPPFAPAGLHEALIPVHDLIHQYGMLDEGAVKDQTRTALLEATAEDLFKDLGWSREQSDADFDTFYVSLHDYLHELALQSQPLGLHSFGVAPNEAHRLTTVMQMLGEDFLALLGLDEEELEELFAEDYRKLDQTPPYRLLHKHLIVGEPLEGIADAALREKVARGAEWYAQLTAEEELAGLLRALDGRYVETSYGGDPIRNPDSLPTGRNLYGFDPSKVPTEAAWKTGQAAVEALIASYQDEHGRPPEKLAFSLWSVETMRHLGVLEAQIFHALGVRPVWDRGGRVVDIEVVSRQELGRPRVDVVLSATGLYRDHFPNVMARLVDAVARVAALDEPDNAVFHNTVAMRERLLALGMGPQQAEELAQTRLFSSESGRYGTGLDDATLATDSWEDEGKLAELYLSRMQYAYGPDQASWGKRYPELNLYAEQLKGVDAAVLARSSNLYGMLTTDDPFQYLGGISLAVRHLTGDSPSLYIANLRDPARSRIDSAARFMALELQSRYFHPGWIEAMQQEGYAGTLNIVDTLNNFWGWQVVDPAVVRDDQWQSFHEVYIQDRYDLEMREWFEQHNPQALAQLVERMLEAVRKEYWEASDETLRELVELWQELNEQHEILPASSQLEPYIAQLAAGFGIGGVAPDAAGAAQSAQVSGQQLAPATNARADLPLWWLALLAIALLLALGVVQQRREQQRLRVR